MDKSKYIGLVKSLLPEAKSYETNDEITHDDVLRGTGRSPTPLSNLFFSRLNISAVQQGIRYSVYKDSKGNFTIDNQSEKELLMIMRSVYLTNSTELPFDIVNQVRDLNKLILDYCVPKIIQELNMNNTYKHDITHMPNPMSRSTNVSIKGANTLERKEF
jgi:hypothetical protein